MKQHVIIFVFVVVVFLMQGCGSSTSSTSDTAVPESSNDTPIVYNGEEYIDSIVEDNSTADVVVVPHHKSSITTLVVLLEYDNQLLQTTPQQWHDAIFGNEESQLNNYYKEVSGGRFLLQPVNESYGESDGVVKVHLSKEHINTDLSESSFTDKFSLDLQAAITQLDEYIDFSLYDEDSDGYIVPSELNVVFVLAGYEDAYEGLHVNNGIWAHQSSLSQEQAPQADGVVLFNSDHHGKYAVFGELHNHTKPHMATVGIVAHELGHALFNLPDLYNTLGLRGGIGAFGLMCSGTWTQKDSSEFPGNTPTHFSGWSKSFIGWVEPRELNNTSTTLTWSASEDYDLIKIPISTNHYYLLENRGNAGYDRGLRKLGAGFVGGIAIWHIDQTKLTSYYFQNNIVNASVAEKGVDLVEAVDPVLDILPHSGGSYKALFYNPNRETFSQKITDISSPSKVMNLTIH